MRERAAELGGTLTVEALPGGGTRVAAALPLEDGPADARAGDETGGDPTVATASPPESAAAAGRVRAMEPIRVLIADDHPLFRDGLRALLESVGDVAVAGEAAGGEEAVALAAELQPDVVLLDIKMPGLNGIEAARRIVAAGPSLAVLMVTMFEDDDSVFAALRAGARGYLLKGRARRTLRAIRAVANGEAIFSRAWRSGSSATSSTADRRRRPTSCRT